MNQPNPSGDGQLPDVNAQNQTDSVLIVGDSVTEPLRRRILKKTLPVVLSGFLHLLLIALFFAVYISITENKPGAGFFAGRGDLGRPADLQRIDGLNEDVGMEQAILPNNKTANVPVERPVATPEVTLRQPDRVQLPKNAAAQPQQGTESLESLVARQWSKSALSSRSPGMKQALLKREGGIAESEKAVARGLAWLAEHQDKDGSWSLSPTKICGNQACGMMENESREAATGLALLPFLGAGHLPGEDGPYKDVVEKGLTWLQSRVDKQGRVIPNDAPTHFHMYAHAIVTIVLCEATALKPEGKWAASAQRAAQYIISAQNRQDGGWRYAPGDPGDTSVYGWQIMALRSARIAGMNMPKSTQTLARRWLKTAQASTDGSSYSYMRGRPATPVMTSEALLCRQLFGDSPKSRPIIRGTSLVFQDLERSIQQRNIYYWYYGTQLMHNTGGKTWSRWNPIIREKLIAEQLTDSSYGHAVGSWNPLEPAMDRWGRIGGTVMQTSLSLLTLEIYYRFLPMYQVDLPDAEDVQAAAKSDSD